MDCQVFNRAMLDEENAAWFTRPWIVEAGGEHLQFDTEDDACAFQRLWRKGMGLDEMTGEEIGDGNKTNTQ